ncbi:hypothetical protein [Pseudonocardia sp. HH130630-07]|uniref:hypothetical protein n=1 Tax=Pseudonocardia sp. HH130630-07 TaxID=1690815 RepID=UPI000814C106|nr:hypothetical protein [Pseudonocardia sp. HH130630-07]ANY10556.1 hypothetical protein AFB00_29550 [Pseudonocardia sp. HH130630-07]
MIHLACDLVRTASSAATEEQSAEHGQVHESAHHRLDLTALFNLTSELLRQEIAKVAAQLL